MGRLLRRSWRVVGIIYVENLYLPEIRDSLDQGKSGGPEKDMTREDSSDPILYLEDDEDLGRSGLG